MKRLTLIKPAAPKKVAPTVFNLPAYRIGPYEMRPVAASRAEFLDQRRKVENDWTTGIVRIDDQSTPIQALSYFMRHLITAIHYRSGLNDKSDEESYTHSLATGMVELARSNPYFWEAFMEVVENTLRPNSGWLQAAGGMSPDVLSARPKLLNYKGRGCKIIGISHEICERKRVYGYYTCRQGIVELSDSLSGSSLALIALHEVLHFLHECEGLKDSTKEDMFKRTQVKMLLTFWKANPNFWRWWLSLVNPNNSASNHHIRVAYA